jgi:ATP adenylyltransferase
LLKPGTLWRSILERTDHALGSGALERIPTRNEIVEQEGVRFLVPVVEILERKRSAGQAQRRLGMNPFLPYEKDLFVADLSDTHVCLLNKFNVVDHHLLIVTRDFEDQENLLSLHDFEAMWICMEEFDGLAFYNAGTIAGASQPHKHLQQVPVPLGEGPERLPIERLFESARFHGRLAQVPGLRFVHTLARVQSFSAMTATEAAEATLALYDEMLRSVGLDRDPGPYNLLVTREWMMMVPRSEEFYETISVNALGFAGSILVRNQQQLDLVRARGPLTILRQVSLVRDGFGA